VAALSVQPELIVAGAGAGDPELITLKAYRLLQEVPVVLYDNLVNKSLLDYTKPDCENIYVGKLPYGDYTPQEQINELIKEKAFAKGRVLRLKGGDPFIFGRGFEEILYARQHGIKTTFIPGITSMQASGLYDIPLTFRNISESIWVVTGTKKDGSLSADLQLAIQSKATVVIYMGMKKLPEISKIYIDKGYGDMPAAIIHYASLPYHKLAKGKIKDLPQLAAEQHITHPALIIIGPVTDIDQLLGTE
jgi:uroporphyrin-III C-methyltransferase